MGKGGPLSSWIREFTTLVFVQTVQAFIFAIIITLIMTAMAPPTDATLNDDYNVGVGLMCVFALTSLFKVEELVKKIFGLQSTKADHGSAIKSIAKTAFAVKLGKRVLDNGKKITGGIKQIKDSNNKRKENKQRYKEDLEDLGIKNPANAKPVGDKKDQPTLLGDNPTAVPSYNKEVGASPAKAPNYKGTTSAPDYAGFDPNQKSLLDSSKPNGKPADNKNIPTKAPAPGVDVSAASSNAAANSNNVVAGSSDGSKKDNEFGYVDDALNSGTLTPKQQQKLRALNRQYKDKEKELNKQRKEGIESIAKGFVEGGGAILGAGVAAVLESGNGDPSEIANATVAGAGVGDAAGEFMVNTVKSGMNFGKGVIDTGKTGKDMIKAAEADIRDIKQQIDKVKQEMEQELKAQGRDAGTIEIEFDAVKTVMKTKMANKPLIKQSIDEIEKNFLKSKGITYGNSVDDVE